MRIINLTQTQYRNYANIHNSKNFGQTVEYTRLREIQNSNILYLGLIDDCEIIHAAVCLTINTISTIIKEAIAKDGFLIDYHDTNLLETFIIELKKYLKTQKITYLKTDPKFRYKIYNKHNVLIESNDEILRTFIKQDFQNSGYQNEFEKYDIIIENYQSIFEIYKNFNRNTKRNIKDSLNTGITLHKGTNQDIHTFYEMIKKKKKNSLGYYNDLFNNFNTKDNKAEIFFTKINVQKFLTNIQRLYNQEYSRNEQIHKTINQKIGKITNKMYNKKINSDKLLNKYHQSLQLANKLSLEGETEIIIGTSAIIRNKDEVYFLIDGYSEKYRHIHSSHLLKWAIIEKYYKRGYNRFNLGEIHQSYYDKNNKYYGQYLYKIGFGGNIIEYPPEMILIINKPVYDASKKINKIFKNNKKDI